MEAKNARDRRRGRGKREREEAALGKAQGSWGLIAPELVCSALRQGSYRERERSFFLQEKWGHS